MDLEWHSAGVELSGSTDRIGVLNLIPPEVMSNSAHQGFKKG